MSKFNESEHIKIIRYPLLHHTIASIIFQSIDGLNKKMPVLLEIDGNLIENYTNYRKINFKWWVNHLSSYSVADASLALSSAWIKFKCPCKADIFGQGTYFYNCESGSFEIEIDSNGMLTEIFAEFDGKTPSFIPDLLNDFPSQDYLSTDYLGEPKPELELIEDRGFSGGLTPRPFQIIEID